jgi:hypothetical protein
MNEPVETETYEMASSRSAITIQHGLIRGISFDFKSVKFSDLEGLAIFEGDICLGSVQEMKNITSTQLIDIQNNIRGIAVAGNKFRWPKGVVYYDVDTNLPNQDRVFNAIEHWEKRTKIRFIRRNKKNARKNPNYVYFTSARGCWSYIGMFGTGRQTISLDFGCSTGNAIHEIGHAIGLWHEQSREDRDNYIRIQWQNILPGYEHNFEQHITDGDDVGPYDYGSIMHYPATAFSKNNMPTIIPLEPIQIGQRAGLSDGDIRAVQAIYPNL